MKLCATSQSERGKTMQKTGNEYINIEILNNKREVMAQIFIEADSKILYVHYNADILNEVKRIGWRGHYQRTKL